MRSEAVESEANSSAGDNRERSQHGAIESPETGSLCVAAVGALLLVLLVALARTGALTALIFGHLH